jgi:dTMP kinase
MFIVFEGIDRSGKTTQLELTKRYLETCKNSSVVEWSFPNRNSITGQICDRYLRREIELDAHTIHLLFSANRWERQQELSQLLAEGNIVLCSRYSYSGIAYSKANGLPYDWLKSIENGLIEPDLIVYLDIDPVIASRRDCYGQERYDKIEFQNKVRINYLDLFKNNPRVLMLDATQSIDKLQQEIRAKITC